MTYIVKYIIVKGLYIIDDVVNYTFDLNSDRVGILFTRKDGIDGSCYMDNMMIEFDDVEKSVLVYSKDYGKEYYETYDMTNIGFVRRNNYITQ